MSTAMFDCAELLAPLSEAEPCGVALRSHAAYDGFRQLAAAQKSPDWARHIDEAVSLARASRDLRAWIWLTRASLCANGVLGLAAGLELIAEGLDRYWDVLPPLDVEETDPRERFMGRLMALTELGVTNYRCNLDELLKSGRNLTDLRADLDKAVAQAPSDAAARKVAARAHAATQAIARAFAARFGAERDPELGFEVLLGRIAAVGPKSDGDGADAGGTASTPARLVANGITGTIGSRGDVVRALDLILAYYEDNEPASPVPLLVRRAKRLVPLSFADAIKELAPSGLKELQIVAGMADERE